MGYRKDVALCVRLTLRSRRSLRSLGRAASGAPLTLNVSDQMPSPGFFVISFVALLLVFLPSAIFFAVGWRSGVLARAISVLCLAVFLFVAWAAFTDPEAPDFEAGAAALYLMWGIILYLGVAVSLGVRFLSRMAKWVSARALK